MLYENIYPSLPSDSRKVCYTSHLILTAREGSQKRFIVFFLCVQMLRTSSQVVSDADIVNAN